MAALTAASAAGAPVAAVFASADDLLSAPMASLGKRFTIEGGHSLTLEAVERVGDTRLQQWHLRFSREAGVSEAPLSEGIYVLRREDGARSELFLQSNATANATASTAQLSRFA